MSLYGQWEGVSFTCSSLTCFTGRSDNLFSNLISNRDLNRTSNAVLLTNDSHLMFEFSLAYRNFTQFWSMLINFLKSAALPSSASVGHFSNIVMLLICGQSLRYYRVKPWQTDTSGN